LAIEQPQEFLVQPVDASWLQCNIECQEACPVGTNCRGYLNLAAEGRFEEGYILSREPNPVAAMCSYVCSAPCERACRRGDIDRPLAIRAMKRFLVEWHEASGIPDVMPQITPRAERVDVVLGDGTEHRLEAGPDGWHRGDDALDLPHGTRYAFRLDGGDPLPDPRSHHQPDGIDTPSAVVDHRCFEWTDAEWRGFHFPGAVLYELHIGTFTPAGTFDGAIERLDHLVEVADGAELHRLRQPRQRIARRDKLLSDVTLISHLDQLPHDRRIVDFLVLIELAAAWVAGGVDVARLEQIGAVDHPQHLLDVCSTIGTLRPPARSRVTRSNTCSTMTAPPSR